MQIEWKWFSFPFDDPRWKHKALFGALVTLVGFVLFPVFWILQGYGIQVMRGMIETGEPSLPEWDDLGRLFVDGFKAFGVIFIYTLPVTLLVLAVVGCSVVGMIPLFSAAEQASEESVALVSSLLSLAWMPVMACFMPLGIFFGYLAQVALTRMVSQDRFSAALELGEVWQLAKRGFKYYALAYALLFGLSMALGVVSQFLIYTIILCCLYPVVLVLVTPYTQVVMGALLGAAYRNTQVALEAPTPSEPAPAE